ncbi:MAG: hypothetical protein AAF399_28750, partial [Bacteroidota bacterium]
MKRLLILLGVAVCLTGIGYVFLPDVQALIAPTDQISSHKDTQAEPDSPPRLYGIGLDSVEVVQAAIQINESLGEILSRYNVSASQIHQVGTLPREVFDARRIKANKPYTLLHGKDSLHTARSFIYHPNPIDYVAVHFSDSVRVEKGQHPVDTLRHSLTGTIQTSLYQAILDAGGSPVLVNELADIYAWEIDFFGLQGGDCFRVLYTTYEVEGETAGFGEIKAARFTHMGKELQAYAYDQGEGREYFDEEGNSLRKTFLKAPLKFS